MHCQLQKLLMNSTKSFVLSFQWNSVAIDLCPTTCWNAELAWISPICVSQSWRTWCAGCPAPLTCQAHFSGLNPSGGAKPRPFVRDAGAWRRRGEAGLALLCRTRALAPKAVQEASAGIAGVAPGCCTDLAHSEGSGFPAAASGV